MSELTQFIDLYCERTAVGVFNEPLNALSNLSFIVAGWWAYRQLSGERAFFALRWLCVLAALIGIGSIAFHTAPSIITQWLDVIPIWAFVISYAIVAVHSATGRRWSYTLGFCAFGLSVLILLFFVTGDALRAAPVGANTGLFNGSIQYLPVVLVLLLFSVGATLMNHSIKRYLWLATGIFAVSLVFRTVDIAVCPVFPVGTHFIWHLLDGVLVAVLLLGLIKASVNSVVNSVDISQDA